MAVIGIDVGGTTIKGAVLGTPPLRTPTTDDPVGAVLAVVDSLATAAGPGLEAIGLAVLGIVDERAGIARSSAALGWADVPLRDLVAARTGRPVVLSHDVRSAALAEATFGAGRGHSHVVFLAIGTGLAVAQIVDGRPVTGASWRAGEIGQLARLEDVSAGRGMARQLDRRLGRPAATSTADEVFAGRTHHHEMVRRQAVCCLAEALAAAITVLDPGVIVVGGGVAAAGAALLDPLRDRIEAALGWREPPPLVPAAFGPDAAWIGAALHAWRLTGRPDDAFPALLP